MFPGSTVPYAPIVEAGVSKEGAGVNQLGEAATETMFPVGTNGARVRGDIGH